jgi:hypothetical protein
MDAPAQVKTATTLLWLSLVISMVDTLVTVMPEEKTISVAPTVTYAATFALWGFLIHFTSKRKWAHILLLALTGLSLAFYFVWPEDLLSAPWWSLVATALYTVLWGAALIMLFSGLGAEWFRGQATAVRGAF